MSGHAGCASEVAERPRHEVAEIFRAHGEHYRRQHPLTPEQRKAMWAIEACRTAVLGGHLDTCADCGHERPSYNSCRNRHCPKCQALAQARWLQKRRHTVLPVPYFHVVFTLPSELRDVARQDPRRVLALLLRAAAGTLVTLGRDGTRLGALLGVTAVLHTWTRDLRWHPHAHCLVTGGGLNVQTQQWRSTGPNYLFSVRVLGELFRGKVLDGLNRAHKRGQLDLPKALSGRKAFRRLRERLFARKWVVYAKRPFAGPEQVFRYLGLYTHRVGISNHRILSVSDDAVTVATRHGRTATMSPHKFIQRFLQHILPKGFVKIRHYGLFASSHVQTTLPLARQSLQSAAPTRDNEPPDAADALPADADWRELLRWLTGVDPDVCPSCGSRRLLRSSVAPVPRTPDPLPRGPP